MPEPTPHSREWYERLAERQEGYFYPWRSTLDAGGGEAAYDALVDRHLDARLDLLDVGCGHGRDVLRFAGGVRSATGYDRVARFLEIAETQRIARDVPNARFVLGDSSTAAGAGRPRLPLEDQSIDLFACRRGPASWIADARRVGRPGAVILQLEAAASGTRVAWTDEVPEIFRAATATDHIDARVRATAERVASSGCKLESIAVHDVAEYLGTPADLYAFLTFGRDPAVIPSFDEVRPSLTDVFERHANANGLETRNCRILWKARV